MTDQHKVGCKKGGCLNKVPLTINVEEVFVHGFYDVLGFVEEDGRSFLHLTEEEFINSKKVGAQDHIAKMEEEYYTHLKSMENSKKRLLECNTRRSNRHKPKSK